MHNSPLKTFSRRAYLFLKSGPRYISPYSLLRALRFSTIQSYVLSEFIISFLATFGFFFFIFLINAMLLIARKYAAEGLPLWAMARLIYYILPSNITYSISFSVLIGAMVSIANLASSKQLLAFKTCGIHRNTILIPLLLTSLLIGTASFFFTDYFVPQGRIQTQKLLLQLLSNNPDIVVKPYDIKTFRNAMGYNTHLISGNVKDQIIYDIFIVDYDKDGKRNIYYAEEAQLSKDRPVGVIPFELRNVTMTAFGYDDPKKIQYATADRVRYNILLGDVTETYRLTPDDRQVWELIQSVRKTQSEFSDITHKYHTDRYFTMFNFRNFYNRFYETNRLQTSRKKIEIVAKNLSLKSEPINQLERKLKIALYFRFSTPFACISFMLLAFAIGALAKNHGKTAGFLIGIFLSTVFWFSLTGGRFLGQSSFAIPPFLLMFTSNILFLLVGIILLMRQSQ